MGKFFRALLLTSLLISLVASSDAQTCSGYSFTNNANYVSCTDLPVLNAFLHWNYNQANHTVDIAYRHAGVTDTTWVAWALNLGATGMVGCQCLVAFRNSSGGVRAYTSPITAYRTQLLEGPLSFGVPSITAEVINNEMIIFATLQLPAGLTTFNQVWQDGQVTGDIPQRHLTTGPNMASMGTVDFVSGEVSGGSAGSSRNRNRNIHGVLNAVSWGVLMPLGALFARYLRVFKSADPAWFYLHVACQTSAYIVGVAGWGTGLKLGRDSAGVTQDTHRTIGIVMFCLGTLQVFALLLRPKPDHKFRFYWNVYHHVVGYTVIALSIFNVFEGFDILDPQRKWKNAYMGVIIAIGGMAAILEAYTWFVVLRRRNKANSNKHQHASNGTNGVGGYSTRPDL